MTPLRPRMFFPILFQGRLVRAILDGRKSQTRRIIKPPRNMKAPRLTASWHDAEGRLVVEWEDASDSSHKTVKCPYGRPGDVLWVRENWATYAPDAWTDTEVLYQATHDNPHITPKWKPSIHMPRDYCRLRLEVVDVRVERLQDITEEDAVAEGVEQLTPEELGNVRTVTGRAYWGAADIKVTAYKARKKQPPHWLRSSFIHAREAFQSLWNSINEPRGYAWESNPWVWRVTFRRLP